MHSRPEVCAPSMPPVARRTQAVPRRPVEPGPEPATAGAALDAEPGPWTGGLFVLVALLVGSLCAWQFVNHWMLTSIAEDDVAPAVLACSDAGDRTSAIVVDLRGKDSAAGRAGADRNCVDAEMADAGAR